MLRLTVLVTLFTCLMVSTALADDYEGDDAGECNDGADNDRDGKFDCEDDGCSGSPACKEGAEDTSEDDDYKVDINEATIDEELVDALRKYKRGRIWVQDLSITTVYSSGGTSTRMSWRVTGGGEDSMKALGADPLVRRHVRVT